MSEIKSYCDHVLIVKQNMVIYMFTPLNTPERSSMMQSVSFREEYGCPFKNHLCEVYPVFRNIPIYPME